MSGHFKYKHKLFTSSTDFANGLDGRISILENNEYKITYYQIISGTSGTITPPSGATFNEGEFGSSGNAILSKITVDNKPSFETPLDAGNNPVTVSLNVSTGAYICSGTYTDTDVALIYSINIIAIDYQNLDLFYIIETEDVNILRDSDIGVTVQGYSANTTLLGNSTTGSGNIVLATSPTFGTGIQVNSGTNSGRAVEIFQNTASVKIGSRVGTTGDGAIYFSSATPSDFVSCVSGFGTGALRLAGGNGINVVVGGANAIAINSFNEMTFSNFARTSGATTAFTWTKANSTGQTASTAINGVLFTLGSRQWNTGAITTQKEFELTSPTYSFVGASTITNAYSLYVNAPTAGTNATITNNYAAGFNGGVEINGQVNIIGGATLLLNNTSGINVQNVGSDRKWASSRTGGNTIFMNHTTTAFQFYNNDTAQVLFSINTSTGGADIYGNLTILDAKNIVFNTTTGSKIGTATTQKIGFWNATPKVQQTTAVAAATFAANTSGIANDTATFDGYTIGQVVKALREIGILA